MFGKRRKTQTRHRQSSRLPSPSVNLIHLQSAASTGHLGERHMSAPDGGTLIQSAQENGGYSQSAAGGREAQAHGGDGRISEMVLIGTRGRRERWYGRIWQKPSLLFNGRPLLRLGLVVQGHLGFHASVDGHRYWKKKRTLEQVPGRKFMKRLLVSLQT